MEPFLRTNDGNKLQRAVDLLQGSLYGQQTRKELLGFMSNKLRPFDHRFANKHPLVVSELKSTRRVGGCLDDRSRWRKG